MKRNRRHVETTFGPRLVIDPAIPDDLVALLFEAETSGGLVFSVAPSRARETEAGFAAQGERAWEIGRVVPDLVLRVR
jgi:selenophosphate synthase